MIPVVLLISTYIKIIDDTELLPLKGSKVKQSNTLITELGKKLYMCCKMVKYYKNTSGARTHEIIQIVWIVITLKNSSLLQLYFIGNILCSIRLHPLPVCLSVYGNLIAI